MSRSRAIIGPHPVATSLRMRAIAREKEIDKAWAVLERHGFPVAAFAGITRRGRLPAAMHSALTVFSRDRQRVKKRADELQARLMAIYPDERRYDDFGEIRLIARVKGHLIVRRPGCVTCLCTQRDWDAKSRVPVRKERKEPRAASQFVEVQ